MRTPLTVTRAGAVKELATALRREKRSVNQIRIRAVLSVARGDHVPTVARSMSVAQWAVRHWVHGYNPSAAASRNQRSKSPFSKH